MRPILFGQTYLSEKWLMTLSSLFNDLTIFQPVRDETEADNNTTIITPDFSKNQDLPSLIQAYKNMAEDYQGRGSAFLRGRTGKTPFYDEALTTHIKNELKHLSEDTHGAIEDDNSILLSSVLLKLAGDFEKKSREVDTDLARIDSMQNSILDALNGTAPEENPHTDCAYQPSLLTDELIEAWLKIAPHCFRKLSEPETFFFIVTEAIVNDYIQEMHPGSIKLFDYTIPQNDKAFVTRELLPFIHTMTFHKWPVDGNQSVSDLLPREISHQGSQNRVPDKESLTMSFYMLPGKNPVGSCMKIKAGQHNTSMKSGLSNNTIIVFLEKKTD
jgi:hypothetical protein